MLGSYSVVLLGTAPSATAHSSAAASILVPHIVSSLFASVPSYNTRVLYLEHRTLSSPTCYFSKTPVAIFQKPFGGLDVTSGGFSPPAPVPSSSLLPSIPPFLVFKDFYLCVCF